MIALIRINNDRQVFVDPICTQSSTILPEPEDNELAKELATKLDRFIKIEALINENEDLKDAYERLITLYELSKPKA